MGRRLGARRLYSLNKQGRSVTGSLGGAANPGIGHRRITRDGDEIMTEIYVDLGSSKGAFYQPGTAGKLIAHSGSDAAVMAASSSYAHLTQITEGENGVITAAEMTCLEAPTGGDPDIDLVYASSLKAYSGSAGTALVAAGGALVLGESLASAVAGLDDNSLKDQYLYLAYGGATDSHDDAAYTAGKLVIRLYGHAVPDDV
jgi:hypothetical protein